MQTSHLAPLVQAIRQEKAVLALAAGAMAGAGAFFAWPVDVPWWPGLVPVGLGLLLAAWVRWAGWGVVMAGLLYLLAYGQVARVGEFNYDDASNKPHWLVGRITDIRENSANPKRVTLGLDRVKMYRLQGGNDVRVARIGVYKSQVAGMQTGENVAIPVILMPPEAAEFPGGMDGRLWRFFNRDVVYGYALGTVEATFRDYTPSWQEVWRERLEGVRGQIFAVSRQVADGVVAALLVGREEAIPPEIRTAYKRTGLSHLLAISGMQVSLVAAGIFWSLRRLAAFWPWLVLRVNVKAWAATLGLAVAIGYTLLAGAGVSVVRACIMAVLVMLAVLLGRLRSAARAWCVAVVLILTVSPVMVMRAGFQLSVAAVLGLVLLALVEKRPVGVRGWLRTLVLSSVVAGAATAPVLVWNFGQFSAVSLVANVVAVPLMTVATYLGMAALVVWPVGLEGPLLHAMGWVCDVVNGWAVWLAGFGWSNLAVAKAWWPLVLAGSLVTMVLAGLRQWGAMTLAMVACVGSVWAINRQEAPVEREIWQDGETAWAVDADGAYRLLWSTNAAVAVRLAEGLGKVVVGDRAQVPTSVDPAEMPVTRFEHFAWAQKRGGVWQVEPVRCGRVWERGDRGCF